MAIQEEEYEQAAKLRDEILQLEANDMQEEFIWNKVQ